MRLEFFDWATVDCRFCLKALRVEKRLELADDEMRSERC
jgi:hypothetical protein